MLQECLAHFKWQCFRKIDFFVFFSIGTKNLRTFFFAKSTVNDDGMAMIIWVLLCICSYLHSKNTFIVRASEWVMMMWRALLWVCFSNIYFIIFSSKLNLVLLLKFEIVLISWLLDARFLCLSLSLFLSLSDCAHTAYAKMQ